MSCFCLLVFRVDLVCSGKVDGEAVLMVQLNLTTHTSNYMVLNFKRRKMCYKSKRSDYQTIRLLSSYVCLLLHNRGQRLKIY